MKQPFNARKQFESQFRERDIANAECLGPDGRGGVIFKLDRQVHGSNVLTLTGYTAPRGIEVGHKGKIVYETTPSSGLFYFQEGSVPEGKGHID